MSALFDLNWVIGQEVVEGVVVASTFESGIIPDNLEGKNLAVIVDILFESIIGVSSSQFDLNVLFVFLCIRRVDFGILGSNEGIEKITRKGFRFVERAFHVLVEFFGEGITIIDSEDPFEDIQVDCNVEVFPLVVIGQFSDDLGNFLPFEEDSLRNASILNFFLGDVDGLIGEVVVDLDGSDPVVFKSAFDHMLLEVGIVSEDLSVVFEPGGLDTGDVVVFRGFPGFHEGEVIDGGAHLVEEMLVDILFQVLPFLLNRAVNEIELLGLVEVLFIGVMEDMSGQEGDLLGDVRLHLLSYIFINNSQ